MRATVQEVSTGHSPESLVASLQGQPGVALLRSGTFDVPSARYSFVLARPVLTFQSLGTFCSVTRRPGYVSTQIGNPWPILGGLLARFELLDEIDLPFPLGGCFGYWGYDLKQFIEPRISRRAVNDLELPDCWLGFYPSLVVFDHQLNRTWIVATGLDADGERSEQRRDLQLRDWIDALNTPTPPPAPPLPVGAESGPVTSSFTRAGFLRAVEQAQRYIRSGDIYQVNLAQRLRAPCPWTGWELYERLSSRSPAPFSAYFDTGESQVVSSSPELFLRLSGQHVTTRPIKGTRPRGTDPDQDARLAWELQRSEKENAELVMITDLLRNDLGRICEYGSIRVPDLARLERYAHVQHLVSTVEGQVRPELSHLDALAACFPGGSITGAPKIRAMEIIDELEPVARGPYCGCHGYLGFNRESQLSITIRTGVRRGPVAWYHAGAGIVADSNPAAEYDETLAKAAGFLAALTPAGHPPLSVAEGPYLARTSKQDSNS